MIKTNSQVFGCSVFRSSLYSLIWMSGFNMVTLYFSSKILSWTPYLNSKLLKKDKISNILVEAKNAERCLISNEQICNSKKKRILFQYYDSYYICPTPAYLRKHIFRNWVFKHFHMVVFRTDAKSVTFEKCFE